MQSQPTSITHLNSPSAHIRRIQEIKPGDVNTRAEHHTTKHPTKPETIPIPINEQRTPQIATHPTLQLPQNQNNQTKSLAPLRQLHSSFFFFIIPIAIPLRIPLLRRQNPTLLVGAEVRVPLQRRPRVAAQADGVAGPGLERGRLQEAQRAPVDEVE